MWNWWRRRQSGQGESTPREGSGLPAELFRQVRRLEVRSKRNVRDLLAGQYASVFRGSGLQFEEVREYLPGDDVRFIDWNVTARMGLPYVKRYREERERTVLLVVDISASEGFGTGGHTKWSRSLEVIALIALSAVLNQDKVGLVTFSDTVERRVPPRKGMPHALRLLRDLLWYRPTGRGTDVGAALRQVRRLARRQSIVFLVSDFCAEGYERDFRIVAKYHDLIAVCVYDERELRLPEAIGLLTARDPETGALVLVDTHSRKQRERLEQARQTQLARLRELCRACDADLVEITTDTSPVHALLRFFRGRERRLAHA